MNIKKISRTALFCISLLGLSIPCFANEAPNSGRYAQKMQQEEAIVVRIDQNNVTLQAVGDKDKISTAPFSNAAEFKVGDKVIISGNTLKKNDVGLAQPSDATSDTKTAPKQQ